MSIISSLAKANDCILVVDSTWTPPLVQQIFDYDVDVLAYSLTKSHNGHSDVVAGAVVCNETSQKGRGVSSRIRDYQITIGGVASPFDCWLVLRGLRTMAARLEVMCASAMKLAQTLEDQNFVEWVRYPGLRSHPQYDVAKRQLDLKGQMVTIKVKGGSDGGKAERVAGNEPRNRVAKKRVS